MTWTAIFGVIGSILAAFVGAAAATWFGFQRWHKQRWIERREHLAEQVLADFYDVRSVFQWIRSPGSYGGEGETRPRPKEELPDLERLRNAYFVPIERMQAQKELFSRLDAARFRFMALFGVEAAKPFETIGKVRSDIQFAAHTLIETADQDQDDEMKNNKATIWWRFDEDEITKAIDEAVIQVEAICRPILGSESRRG